MRRRWGRASPGTGGWPACPCCRYAPSPPSPGLIKWRRRWLKKRDKRDSLSNNSTGTGTLSQKSRNEEVHSSYWMSFFIRPVTVHTGTVPSFIMLFWPSDFLETMHITEVFNAVWR
jgi:hypothetical protein